MVNFGFNFDFKRAENLLYNYHANAVALEITTRQIRDLLSANPPGTSCRVPSYDERPGTASDYWPSDPEAARVIKIEAVTAKLQSKLKNLRRDVEPVERFLADLNSPEIKADSKLANFARIVELLYFFRRSRRAVAVELHISERSVARQRIAIIRLLTRYI